jgi:molecular chaperone GrpE
MTTQPPNPHENSSDASDSLDSAAQDGSPDRTPDALQARIYILEQSLRSAENNALLAQAELENFRKRIRRDYEDQLKFAAMPLIRDMLPVMDNLRRAVETAKPEQPASSMLDGLSMIISQLDTALAKNHCRPIPAVGEPFDPNFHEALTQFPSPDHEAGIVIQEAQAGYQLHDRVIRPSQVIISSGSSA